MPTTIKKPVSSALANFIELVSGKRPENAPPRLEGLALEEYEGYLAEQEDLGDAKNWPAWTDDHVADLNVPFPGWLYDATTQQW